MGTPPVRSPRAFLTASPLRARVPDGLALATPGSHRYAPVMRRFVFILVVGLVQTGVVGCASRDFPCDQVPPGIPARQLEAGPYRAYAYSFDSWFQLNAPLTREVLKSIGESARANEANTSAETTHK